MMAATLSLGVQQVLLDVGQWWGLRLAVALLALAWLWARVRRERSDHPEPLATERMLARALVLALFLRFAVPLTIIANEALYEVFLEPRYEESTQVIESAGQDIEALRSDAAAEAEQAEEEQGFFESLGGTFDAFNFRQKVEVIADRAGDVIEHLIQLSVVFILQTGILPVAFLWIFLQILKGLFRFKN
jgi:hypothetical protein